MIPRKYRGFKITRKITRIFKWVIRKPSSFSSYKYEKLLDGPTITRRNIAISKLCKWARKIKRRILNTGSTRKYIQLGHDTGTNTGYIPKGHLVVHVGEPSGDTLRVLVPVMFVNHPLFEKLLKEAESVYGFNHPGRITIPCPVSEFESVKSRIAASNNKLRPRIFSCVPTIDLVRI